MQDKELFYLLFLFFIMIKFFVQGFRLQNAAEMYASVSLNILMVDYRGYGRSVGTPNEKGLQLDGEAVLEYVKNHPKLKGKRYLRTTIPRFQHRTSMDDELRLMKHFYIQSPIILFGRSLGGAVSFYLASQARYSGWISAVIVENTFLRYYCCSIRFKHFPSADMIIIKLFSLKHFLHGGHRHALPKTA